MSSSLRYRLKLVALVLALAAASALVTQFVRSARITYRIAVPETSETPRRVLQDIGRVFADEKSWVALKRVSVSDFEESAKAVREGKADLALVRPDIGAAPNASTVGIVRRDPAYLIVPASSKIEGFKNLRRTTVGVLVSATKADEVLDKILDYYEIPRAQVLRMPVSSQQIGAAIREKKIDSVFVIGHPQMPEPIAAFAAVTKAGRGTPDIVGVDEAEALAKRSSGLSSDEMAQGAFGGANPRPEEALDT